MARSYIKDFLAGVDPTGTETTRYGVKDAPKSGKERRVRSAVGTAGGILGGGLVVPSVVSGIIGGVRGAGGGVKGAARGFAQGLAMPISRTLSGAKLHKILRTAEGGKKLTKADVDAAIHAAGVVFPGAGKAVSRAQSISRGAVNPFLAGLKKLTPAAVSALPKSVVTAARKKVGSDLRAGVGGLGLAGAIGGGSAALQYQKGGRLGQNMSPEQRRRV